MSDRTRVIGVTGGALGLGGLAAALGLCCTVPWAVALLGVGGAIAFARLAFLMPYALIGAGVLLAGGFWVAYRPAAACADGGCSVASRRGLRLVVWIATTLVCALGFIALNFRVTS